MTKHRTWVPLFLAAALFAWPSQAFNGFLAGSKGEKPLVHTTQVVVMTKGDSTALTVMPDYEGPIEAFAIVMVVPGDVTAESVRTLKREFVDRVDLLTAPRFHEFWEQDPCDQGPVEQEWERHLKVEGGGFLGGGSITGSGKVAKELYLDVEAKTKEGEYQYTVLDTAADLQQFLNGHGYRPPEGAVGSLDPYLGAGMKILVAEVDPKRIELIGGDRAQLSPIRYATQSRFDTIIARPGLANSPGHQELVIYVLHPEARYEVKNYKTLLPPTNINLDFSAKERMGEFYAALQDIILAKNPKSFLMEYAWSSDGCGMPCATEPLLIHELLSLGGDVFEEAIPEEERNPEPPELSEDEEKAQKAELELLKPKERREREKQIKEERQTIATRKALLERQKYMVSRLHYRYDAAGLPSDPKIGPASDQVEGGVALPKGPKMEATTEVSQVKRSRFQARYNNFHPWVPVIHCDNPERGKWGKSGRDYRGLRKVWVVEDLSRKSRTQIVPAKVVLTPIPSLGLSAATPAAADGAPDAGPDAGAALAKESAKDSKCGCQVPGGAPSAPLSLLGFLGAGLWARRRRRR